MNPLKINFLDHVAIRVSDLEKSTKWYKDVLGLKVYHVPKWKGFPIFLLAGKTGIALFPAHSEHPELPPSSLNVK